MVSLRKYDKGYEDGKCPYGFEYVAGYNDSHMVWHESYCRKVKKVKISDEERVINREKKEEQEALEHAKKIFWEDE